MPHFTKQLTETVLLNVVFILLDIENGVIFIVRILKTINYI